MTFKPNFRKGRCYLRHDGVPVRVIKENDDLGPHYRCVQGDDGFVGWIGDFLKIDGEWQLVTVWSDGSTLGYRYDRASDSGRCTGSHFFYDPRNLVVGSNWTLRAIWYRIKCELKDFANAYIDSMGGNVFACGYQ